MKLSYGQDESIPGYGLVKMRSEERRVGKEGRL